MAVVRVRQHVNPLSQKYQQPVEPPAWERVYADESRSLLLDIGCARGRFALQLAEQWPDWNMLGLEIREPLVIQANEICQSLGYTNLHYMFCNANNSLEPILRSLPAGKLQWVTIQFPDPWFKKRHQKRRVVQPDMVDLLATFLSDNGNVFLQSDVEDVLLEMGDRFREHSAFVQLSGIPQETENPFPIATERELSTLENGDPVYRMIFAKRSA
ncbi:tRNA (guanosine(46)-N7)-methyltransferase TrmB [Leptolyngbya sp. AN02str]|uniref:tRNA (guanosine(46)-N7)-methyltransferase TrmB n=1 Tax=Leptolyngbya sp. AN02str TaxID=3423363 RepID=UPI003D31C0C7